MTKTTIDGLSVKIDIISKLLEKEFDLNRRTHEKMIEKQNITNGNIIRHDDRLNHIETRQHEHRDNHDKSVNTKRWWLVYIPTILMVLLTVVNVYANYSK